MACLAVPRSRPVSLRFREPLLAARDVTELGNVIVRKAYADRRFDLLPLQQDAEFLVTNFRALLERDFVSASEHESRYDQGNASHFLTGRRDRKIKAPRPVFDAFESEVADVEFADGLFHKGVWRIDEPPTNINQPWTDMTSNSGALLAPAVHLSFTENKEAS